MKIVLVNPSSILSKGSDGYSRFVSPIPVLGLAYLGAVLTQHDIDVVVIDQLAERLSNNELLIKIFRTLPDVVGFSCLTPAMSNVRELVLKIRARNEKIKIIFGNTHANVFIKEVFFQDYYPDIVVRGEGEITMLELIQAIKMNKSLAEITGISWFEKGIVYHNPDRDQIADLNVLPFPAWHLFDLSKYKKAQLLCLNDSCVVPVQTSRGCSYSCTFCSQDQIFTTVRKRSVNNVLDEIEHNLDLYNLRRFGFIDANFPLEKDYCLDFCDGIKQRNLQKAVKWVTETRVDKVDYELLLSMKEAGLHLIMYGFEVGNQQILDSINKKTTLARARQAMKDTKKAGVLTLGLFILGMPGETKETCEQTIRFAKELDCDVAKFNIAVPLPGSKFFNDYREEIISCNLDNFTSWTDWSSEDITLVYKPKDLSAKELIDLQRQAMLRFYMRPALIIRHILKGTIPYIDLFFGAYILLFNYFKFLFEINSYQKKKKQ